MGWPAVMWPYLSVAVVGASMEGTLRDGDWLVVRRCTGTMVRAGHVIVVERPDRLGFLIVKRAVRRTHSGWWVEGDNRAFSDDSRLFGVVQDEQVVGRVIARYHPRPALLRSV